MGHYVTIIPRKHEMLLSVCSCLTPAEKYQQWPIKCLYQHNSNFWVFCSTLKCMLIRNSTLNISVFSNSVCLNGWGTITRRLSILAKLIHFPAQKQQLNSSTLSKFISFPTPPPPIFSFCVGEDTRKAGEKTCH